MKTNTTFTHRLLLITCFLIIGSFNLSLTAQNNTNQIEEKRLSIQKDKKVSQVQMSPTRATPLIIEFDAKADEAYHKEDISKLFRSHLKVRPGVDELRLAKNTEQNNEVLVRHYQQYYQGIPVEHGRYTALLRNDELKSINGEFYDVGNLNIASSLTEEQALELALNYIDAEEYVWEYIAQFQNGVNAPKIAAALYQEYETHYPKGELVIVDDFNTESVDLALAYRFNIYANKPLSRDWVYVNASDGSIMLRNAIIKHASVQTRYSGVKDIFTSFVPGSNPSPDYIGDTDYHILLDETRGSGIQTYDMNGLGGAPISVNVLYELASDFVDDDDNWTLDEHVRVPAPSSTEVLNDDVAWDAHWGAAMVYDYWKERHNRDSYDGNDAKINSYIHYGEGYDNAFWNGSAMTYGDGSYRNTGIVTNPGFSPLTSIDVCAHEIGHAVCEHTADLVYQKESGAMNEGFSDIWAACVENYILERYESENFEYNTWGIGEQIDQRDGFGNLDKALRWMDDPKRAGDPDTYGGDNWVEPECGEPTLANDYCGVHTNSGILNKWFYLMTAGSGNTPDDSVNDHGNNYQISGLGFATSEVIAFGTEVLLSPNATFAEARAASLSFVRSVYGPCSVEEEAVTNAWYAIGVGTAYGCESTISTGFLATAESVNEAVNGLGFCDDSKLMEIPIFVNSPVLFDVEVSGTATAGKDYILHNTTVSHTLNTFSTKVISIELIDDDNEEGEETIILTLPNGLGATSGSDQYTLSIIDDDVAPKIGIGATSLLYERFISSSMPSGWNQKVIIGSGSMNQWHFGSYQGKAYISATGFLPNYEGNNNETDVILYTPLIDARGLTDLSLSFDWTAGGETDVAIGGAAPFDYGSLVYSFDGEQFYSLGEVFVGDNLGATVSDGNLQLSLGEAFSNQQFYLGWRWINDPLIGTAYSFTIDNVRVNAQTRQIADELAQTGEAYLGPNATTYFYDGQDGTLLATVKNNSTKDYGCTSISISRAGTGVAAWYNGGESIAKAFTLEPTFNHNNANLEVTVYYTAEELEGWEQENSLGEDRTDLHFFSSKVSNIEQATAGNTQEFVPVYEAIYKTPSLVIGGKYTGTITKKLGSMVLASASQGAGLVRQNLGGNQVETSDLILYPNPAREQVQFRVPETNLEGQVFLRVMNIHGQMVLGQKIVQEAGDEFTLDISDIPGGTYFVVLEWEDLRFYQKLVKQ